MVDTMTLLNATEYLCLKCPRITSTFRKYFPIVSSFMTQHMVCNQSNTTGATSDAATVCPSGAPEVTPSCQWDSSCSIISFLCIVLQTVVCPFVLFLLAIVLSVLRLTNFDYLFGIFQLFFQYSQLHIYNWERCGHANP